MSVEEVNRYFEQYDEEWLIAAIVDGSVGYYSPQQARKLLNEWRSGKRKCFSERCMALYGCDLGRMLLSDFRKFEHLHERGLTAPVLERVRAWLSVEESIDPATAMELSLMYPTL